MSGVTPRGDTLGAGGAGEDRGAPDGGRVDGAAADLEEIAGAHGLEEEEWEPVDRRAGGGGRGGGRAVADDGGKDAERPPVRMTQEHLREIFDFYCNFGRSNVMTPLESLDSFMFMKFARECPGLLGHDLTRTDVDLIFTKAKPKFERRLDFEHFLDALSAVAEKKYPEFEPRDGLRQLLTEHLAPHYALVEEEYQKSGETEIPLTGIFKRLTDPRTYTGVYAARTLSGDGRINGEADNRPGRTFMGNTNTRTDEVIHDISVLMRPDHRGGTMMAEANHSRRRRGGGPFSPRSPPGRSPRPKTAVSSGRSSSGRREKKDPAMEAAMQEALEAARAGDPSKLAEIVKELEARQSSGSDHDAKSASKHHSAEHLDEEQVAQVLDAPPPLTQEDILEMFDFYCNFGRSGVMTVQDSMDSFMFMKFARECPGLLGRDLTRTDVDLIFTKAKPIRERRLTYTHFLDALSAIAEKKFPDYAPADGLRLLIAIHLKPHHQLVLEERAKSGETEIPLTGIFKRLTDPRTYTGVYAARAVSGDGRINGEADNRPGRTFTGNTNTNTDEVIHDISVLMRPNLRGGTMMTSRPKTAGGSPRRRAPTASPTRSFMSPTSASRQKVAAMQEDPRSAPGANWY